MKRHKNKKIFLGFILLYILSFAYSATAYVASSSNYRIQSDSINVGGLYQTSTSFISEDTIGEMATGISTSTSYKLKAGYQQMHESYISISLSTSSVVLLPPINGFTGGTATGTYTATIVTDNPAGYSLYINASTTPALRSVTSIFADYTPVNPSTPDYDWLINPADSEFGFTPEGSDIVQKFKDNGSNTCAVSTNDTPDKCWYEFSTSTENIVLKYSSNYPSGSQTTIKLKAEAGASHSQAVGIYQGIIINTATAN